MKKLVLALERRVTENMKLRDKYAAEPHKFINSEIELYAELKRLHALATAPHLFPAFVATQAVQTLLSLLAHENSDISIEVVDLLSELTDTDLLISLPDLQSANSLVESLLESSAVELVVGHLSRLDEAVAEESDAVHKSLQIIENLLEAEPARVAELIVDATPLLKWLLQRLKPRAFDANKLYASEILSILLQTGRAAQLSLGSLDGMDSLLLAVSSYKRKDPATSEERELAENLFDAICSAVLLPANQTLFLKAEGIELMLLTLREAKGMARSALKALDFELQRNAVCCERLVDSRGLGTIFPYVSGHARLPVEHAKSKAERRTLERDDDEHLVSILCSLCHELDGTYRQRLFGKFVEGGFEKVARLVDLRMEYAQRVAAFVERHRLATDGDADDEDGDEEEARFLGMLEAGALTEQLATAVLAYLIVSGDPVLSRQTLLLLHDAGVGIHDMLRTLADLRDSMGDEKSGVAVTNNSLKVQSLYLQLERLAERLVRKPIIDTEFT